MPSIWDALNFSAKQRKGYAGGAENDPGLYIGEGWNNPYDQARRAETYARAENADAVRQSETERGTLKQLGGLIKREGITPESRKQIMGGLTQISKVPVEDITRDPALDVARLGQEWVNRGGKAMPITKGTAQTGDTPYDPVAVRSAQPANPAEAVDTAREVARIAGALRQHKGFGGTFGKYSSLNPTFTSSQDTVDARTLLNSLRGLLTIENMGKMKGVLSDADMRILQQASTTLAPEMSEPAAAAELDRLVEVMSRVTSGGSGGGTIRARDPQGNLHEAPAGTPLPDGWRQE